MKVLTDNTVGTVGLFSPDLVASVAIKDRTATKS